MRTLLALLLLAGSLGAQTIEAREFLPLSRWAAWLFEQVDDPSDTRLVKVLGVQVEDEEVRYNVAVPQVGSLDVVRLRFGLSPDGTVLMHSMRIIDNQFGNDFEADIELGLITFNPPIQVGTAATQLDQPPHVQPVATSFKAEVDVGPFEDDVTVFVNGTISIQWLSVGAPTDTLLPAPDDSIGAADLVRLIIVPDLVFSGEVEGEDFEEELGEEQTLDLLLARDVGFVSMEATSTASARQLRAAILAGRVLGEGFPPNTDIASLAIPVGDTFSLDDDGLSGGTGTAELGPDVVISGLTTEHLPNGKLEVLGQVTTLGADAGLAGAELKLKGKLKLDKKSGQYKLTLKGKAKDVPGLEKPLVLKGVGLTTSASDTFALTYKSAKDALGTIDLGLNPEAPVDGKAHLELDGLVDTKFEVKSARKLGSEGLLHFADTTVPVLVKETAKTFPIKEGKPPKPDKRVYTVSYAGMNGKPMKILAQSDEEGHLMLKLTFKHYGTKLNTKEPEAPASGIDKVLEDVIE